MGLLSLEPKYADGTPVTDFSDCILYDETIVSRKNGTRWRPIWNKFGRTARSDRPLCRCGRRTDKKRVSGSLAPGRTTDWTLDQLGGAGIALLLLAGIVILFRFCPPPRKRNRR